MTVTKLDLGDIAMLPGSDRSISETLEPISEAAQLRRTINGRLVNTGDQAFRKYRISLSGTDLRPPALDGIWPGMAIEISAITELTKRDATPVLLTLPDGTRVRKVDLGREPVPGSVTVKNTDNVGISMIAVAGASVYLDRQVGEVYVTYRPRLSCIIENWSSDEDEAAASVSWSLSALEV